MNRYEKHPEYVTVYPEAGGKGYAVVMPDGTRLPAVTEIVITDDYIGDKAAVSVTLMANFASEPLTSSTPPPYISKIKNIERKLEIERERSAKLEFVETELQFARRANKDLAEGLKKERQKWWYRLFSSLCTS